MTFITLTDSGYRAESGAEFYLMVNRDRPIEQGHQAVLQMRRKADHITIEPIIGVIAETVERLKMAGVTELMIPRKDFTAAEYRKLTDEYVDKMTKIYENDYDVEAADQAYKEKIMKAIVWSKDHCPYCVQAKTLLEQKGIEFEERKIGEGYTKEDLLEAVPNARTVPQIFLDGELVGGFTELRAKFLAEAA